MNLKHKFIFWCGVLMALVLTLGSVSIWNITSQWRVAQAAAAEYDAMDRADAATVQVGWLRDSLRGAEANTYRSVQFFLPIETEITEIIRELRLAARVDDGDGSAELALGQAAGNHLTEAMRHSVAESVNLPAGTSAAAKSAAGELDQVRQTLLGVSKLIPGSVRHHIAASADRLGSRLIWLCIVLLVVLVLSTAVHVTQFRVLVLPLLWLREDMRRSAAGEYKAQVRLRGDREFKDVAAFFNGLAKELANLYWGLEKKVIDKSRELVRSERLASVGFLAAGVAHEINNPLSVISGYAELAAGSLRRLVLGDTAGADQGSEAEAEALASVLEAQGIIRDEAFRCKEITSRLLSLARGGSENRQSFRLDEAAQQVSVLTKGLRNYRDCQVILEFKQTDSMEIVANLTEIKQVLLNLTVNALEAVASEHGEVRIGGRRSGDWVELSVNDNGKGMTPETLEHVFEPFFTAKRGVGEPGTGLGLSITHAIVENHGGSIRVESDGPGHGSKFTVRFPASPEHSPRRHENTKKTLMQDDKRLHPLS